MVGAVGGDEWVVVVFSRRKPGDLVGYFVFVAFRLCSVTQYCPKIWSLLFCGDQSTIPDIVHLWFM